MKRVGMGIRAVDKQLGGGFARGCCVFLVSESPSEKRLFAEQFIVTGVRDEETCVYVDFYRSPSLARSHFKRFGISGEDLLIIVDAVSSQIMATSREKYSIHDLLDMNDISSVIQRALEKERPVRVILDSLEFLVDRFPKEAIMDFWYSMRALSKENNSVLLTLFTNWILERRELNNLKKSADCVLEFKTERMGNNLLNLMKVHENKEIGLSESNWMPYAFKEYSGVVTYSPRIMVTGSTNSGKSSFIRSLCSRSVVDEDGNIGEGCDRGRIDISNIETEVFGVPGEESFASTFRLFCREVSGIFLILDSTRSEDFVRGKEIIDSNPDEVPLVVVANKQDLEGAVSADEIRKRMNLPDAIPIVETSLSQNENVSPALQQLLRLMTTT